jgi:hypothetical protein
MPTLLFVLGFRFFFYSNENDEPIHVHVTKGNATGKIWLEPDIEVVYFRGFKPREQKQILDLINKHADFFKQKWNEYFSE